MLTMDRQGECTQHTHPMSTAPMLTQLSPPSTGLTFATEPMYFDIVTKVDARVHNIYMYVQAYTLHIVLSVCVCVCDVVRSGVQCVEAQDCCQPDTVLHFTAACSWVTGHHTAI